MPKSKPTIDQLVIRMLAKTAKPYERKLAAIRAKAVAKIDKITHGAELDATVLAQARDKSLDALLVDYSEEKGDQLLVAAGIRVDSGIEAITEVGPSVNNDGPTEEDDAIDELTDEGCFSHG